MLKNKKGMGAIIYAIIGLVIGVVLLTGFLPTILNNAYNTTAYSGDVPTYLPLVIGSLVLFGVVVILLKVAGHKK